MNLITRLYGRIMAVWAIIIFIITMIPAYLIIWMSGIFKEPKSSTAHKWISHVWMRIFFFLTGCSLFRRGKNNFEKGLNYIVICNHNSLMDVPVTTPFIPGPANKTIAKIEMAKTPLFGLIYKRGSVLVDRNDKKSRADSFIKMKRVLEMGLHMCIYPEGTRNKTDQPLKEFHDGAFRLAIETGKPIMPALLFNTKKVLDPDRGFYFFPSRMEMHFLKPFKVYPEDDVASLREKSSKLMTDYYVQHYKPS